MDVKSRIVQNVLKILPKDKRKVAMMTRMGWGGCSAVRKLVAWSVSISKGGSEAAAAARTRQYEWGRANLALATALLTPSLPKYATPLKAQKTNHSNPYKEFALFSEIKFSWSALHLFPNTAVYLKISPMMKKTLASFAVVLTCKALDENRWSFGPG